MELLASGGDGSRYGGGVRWFKLNGFEVDRRNGNDDGCIVEARNLENQNDENPNTLDVNHKDKKNTSISTANPAMACKGINNMVHKTDLVIIGVSVGLTVGILIATLVLFGIRWYKRRSHLRKCSAFAPPIHKSGTILSESFSNPVTVKLSTYPVKTSPLATRNNGKERLASVSGLLKYSYRLGCLFADEKDTLNWGERLQIAVDISHGIEYLHDGVADFGLSKEEVWDGRNSGVKGTYGYIDPVYISTNKFTTKSDIYSFGIILFELITAIHPRQNLTEYVNLAAMSSDGADEILDKKLAGDCDLEEVRSLASIAHRCLHKSPRKRPTIGEVSQAITKLNQKHLMKADSRTTMSFGSEEFSGVVSCIEVQQNQLKRMISINEG
ncbi:Protein kinase, catalytic domain-containing protein [Cynara cardunculus var. scolymus]|uniref:Protein kinase, catalytic domain-containing protein n=1 Tax=Cynara cardunculus var. scolymus TaxID=59895 RepID=A0A118K1C9_CYNCS|nr:Protein kinase, catalytic domain-containing protein [Cynara cardunculus var. scolymus]